jgi:hypothetical protein
MGISSLGFFRLQCCADRQRYTGFTLYHRLVCLSRHSDRSRFLVVVSLLLTPYVHDFRTPGFVCCMHLSVLFPSSLNVRFSYTANDANTQCP